MRRTVSVVCSPGVAPGFALAGIGVLPAAGGRDAAQRLDGLADGPTGVVFIEDRLYHDLPPEARQRLARRAEPIVLPFPGPSDLGRVSAEEYVVELLRRAIGYRVRLR